uniref:DAC domain-containing protein n=1 Tax=Chromera velia CCMP2878 TaxID=1169474 RepID=A0A0G4HB97_9ALVE|eukprot:Cvel_916.t1-p1 / transcript=Cvel_916.t1 / gene=Cvel_916 / organism=Chromera_velia_CCMP2878 / gene_product=hypothetical protein / transcript_product=hypothetical protein / location=Cvel_scaffold29:48872-51649(-) / protein_length=728 / sequence_SO=supercontig / SO=protein_coding / is_pseudo=false
MENTSTDDSLGNEGIPFARELEKEDFLDLAVYRNVLRIASRLACTGKESKYYARIYVIGRVDEILKEMKRLDDGDMTYLLEGRHKFVLKEDGSPDEDGERFINQHVGLDGAWVIDGKKCGRIRESTVKLQSGESSAESTAPIPGAGNGTGHAAAFEFSERVRDCLTIKVSEDSMGEVFVCFRGHARLYAYPNPRARRAPVFSGNALQRNGSFQGRKEEREKIEEMLFSREKQGCISTALVVGLGGMGKTQTAKEFLHQTSEKGFYDVLLWLDAAGDMEAQYRQVAEQFDADGLLRRRVSVQSDLAELLVGVGGFLSSRKRWLLVFDNVEDRKKLGPFIPNIQGSSKGHVLITARERIGVHPELLELGGLQKEDARQLLSCLLPPIETENSGAWREDHGDTNKNLGDAQDSPLEKLLALLGGYPLTIVQAGAYLSYNRSCSIAEYIEMCDTNYSRIEQREEEVLQKGIGPDRYELSVRATLQLTLDRMQREDKHGTLGVQLLRAAACFDSGGFLRRLLKRAATALVRKSRGRDGKQVGGQMGGWVTGVVSRVKYWAWGGQAVSASEFARRRISSWESLFEEVRSAINLLELYSLVTSNSRLMPDRSREQETSTCIATEATELVVHRVVRELALQGKSQQEGHAKAYSAALSAIRDEEDMLMGQWEILRMGGVMERQSRLDQRPKEISSHLSAVLSHYFAAAEAQQKFKKRGERNVRCRNAMRFSSSTRG